ncbi:MAG: flagellar basal-body rod protein FlgB [Lentisphaerae bacterium GWF2_52_8]|nr:MAG: flagellar basal-body rod protein FlgB [Lentisphaerae bacterium GWF2_52_8]
MSVNSPFFDDTTLLSSKLMEIATERQRVIANNIANAETPGYIRLDIDFQKKLADAIGADDMQALGKVRGKMVKDTKDEPKVDGNNVLIPREMNEMMQNGVLYSLLNRAFSTRINIIKSAITSK